MSDGIVIKISGDPKDLEKAVKDVKKLFGQIGDDAKQGSGVATAAWGSFIGNFASQVALGAIGAVKDALGAVFDKFKGGVGDAMEAEKSVQKFNLALANTGTFSTKASQDFQDFADQLEKTANISEEATLQAGALLQSYANLDSQGLKRATQAAADLSAVLGGDLESNAKLLGKAADGNVEALQKLGITVENTGNKAKDFETALKQVEQKFGGSAVQSINTFSGAVDSAGNSFDDLFKAAGEGVTTTPELKGAFQGISVVFQDLTELIKENKGAIQDFVAGGVDLFIDGVGLAGKSVAVFFELKQGFSDFFAFLGDAFLAGIQSFQEFGLGVSETVLKVKEFFGANTDGTQQAIQEYKNQIQALQEVRNEDLARVNEENNLTDQRVAKINEFTDTAVAKIREKVEAARLAGEEENANFFLQRSAQAEASAALDAQELERIRAYQSQVLAEAQGTLAKSTIDEVQNQTQKLINEGKYTEAKRVLAKTQEQIAKDSIFAVRKFEDLTNKEKVANLKDTFGQIASLQASGSKELFAIGKGAAIATATIDGIAAVQKALSAAPPPFNFALAALVGVAQASNLAKIASAAPPSVGMMEGGVLSGGMKGVDSIPVMGQPGEIYAPPESFDDVVEGTARQRGFVRGDENAGVIEAINRLTSLIESRPTIQVGTLIADDNGINELAGRLRDAVQFRGAMIA